VPREDVAADGLGAFDRAEITTAVSRPRYNSAMDETNAPELMVVGLRIEKALVPEWFDEVRKVASRFVRRMAVIEKPDELVVQCELPASQVEAFHAALAEAWAAFNR